VRLFVALRPPPEERAHLQERLASLGSGRGQLRWTPTDLWHLTLAFLGEVDERRYAELTPRLARAAGRAGELALSLEHAGTFPRRADRARVLWVGLAGDRPAVTRLAGAVSAAARRSGIPVEDRRFSPHLTLARARPSGGVDVTSIVRGLSAYAGPPWAATELELVRSHLGSSVRHEILARWALGKGAHPGDPAAGLVAPAPDVHRGPADDRCAQGLLNP